MKTIIDLIIEMERELVRRDSLYKQVYAKYPGSSEGRVAKEQASAFQKEMQDVKNKWTEGFRNIQNSIINTGKDLLTVQPPLANMESFSFEPKRSIPERLFLGYYEVDFGNGNTRQYPRTVKFPFEKPLYVSGIAYNSLVYKILLRLLFTLPIDKQEYYFFDPKRKGETFQPFNSILDNEFLCPNEHVITDIEELKNCLKKAKKDIEQLNQRVLTYNNGTPDWKRFNNAVEETGDLRKRLPYKVFVLMDIDSYLDKDIIDFMQNIANSGAKLGYLLIYSISDTSEAKKEEKTKNQLELEFNSVISDSYRMQKIFGQDENEEERLKLLKLRTLGDVLPSDEVIAKKVAELSDTIRENKKTQFVLHDLLPDSEFHTHSSIEGLSFPIGFDAKSGTEVMMEFHDQSVHYFVGGGTGSGKTNLLHNIILSSSWRYSPDELQLFLLDYKDGVGFKLYDTLKLPNAKLVAIQADESYGTTVLEHIHAEVSRRNELFKTVPGCADYVVYRQKKKETLPRIILIIDEFQKLLSTSGGRKSPYSMNCKLFSDIARESRSAGIHMLLATQTLQSLDGAREILEHFKGRIALSCSSNESTRILGGQNEEASKLSVPYAIKNEYDKDKDDNQKLFVTKACREVAEQEIPGYIQMMIDDSIKKGIDLESNVVYEGELLPDNPGEAIISERIAGQPGTTILLGRKNDFVQTELAIHLGNTQDENILVLGNNDEIKKALMGMIISSAVSNDSINSLVYVGNNSEFKNIVNESVVSFDEFVNRYNEKWADANILLIVDEVSFDNKKCTFAPNVSLGRSATDEMKQRCELINNIWERIDDNKVRLVSFFRDLNDAEKRNHLPDRNQYYSHILMYDGSDPKDIGKFADEWSLDKLDKSVALFENHELAALFRPYKYDFDE